MDKERLKEDLFEMDMDCLCYGKREFFSAAKEYLQTAREDKEFCVIAVDVEHFKLFNEWYGREAGDKFLIDIAAKLRATCDITGGVAGYLGDDNFAVVMPHSDDALMTLSNSIVGRIREYEDSVGFLPGFGVYRIEDTKLSMTTMYDRAVIALEKIKGNYSVRMNYYEKGMMLKMEEEHAILRDMPKALFEREFTFDLQPKCNMTNGKIIGAEALVRWRKPDGTEVRPNEFIPILEKNGFITNLDKFIWEEVCHFQRGLIDRGIRPVPISINVSGVDIFSMRVSRYIGNLMRSYKLDPRFIEVEITEGIYAEKMDDVNFVVQSLRNRGMHVSMDDFGSGYSSLNVLNDVNIDVLKIDMKFLNINKKEPGKGVGILEAVINMARMMGIKVIVEGVENMEQVDFLIRMGCEYAQGFFYYKPVTVEEFEELLIKERSRFDYNGMQLKENNQLHIRELMNENLFSETIVNNILGAVAFVEVYDDTVEIIRTNDIYERNIRTDELKDVLSHKFPMSKVYEEDRKLLLGIFQKAFDNPMEGATGEIRYVRSSGRIVCYRIRAFYLRENNGKRMFYGSITDISEEKQQELELRIAEKQLASALRISKINCFDWDVQTDTWTLINTYATEAMKHISPVFAEKQVVINGYSKIYESAIKDKVVNSREVLESFKTIISGKDISLQSIDVEMECDNSDNIWINVAIEAVLDMTGSVSHIIGSFRDITDEKRARTVLEKKALTDELTGLYNRHGGIALIEDGLSHLENGENAALIILDLDNFKGANDTYGHQFGDTLLKQVAEVLNKSFRETDVLCRLGGDEFMVLCKGVDDVTMSHKAEEVVSRIRTIDGGVDSYKASCSIGYVMAPQYGKVFNDLYKSADEAMFNAKKLGKNSFYAYNLED